MVAVLRHRPRRSDLFRLQHSAGVACRPHSGQRRTQASGAEHVYLHADPRDERGGSPQHLAGLPEGAAQHAQDFLRKPGHLLIDGEWVEAASGKTFETLNPATEESLGWVAHGAAEDIELAVARRVGALTTSARTGAG